MRAVFWGTRGSLSTPLTAGALRERLAGTLKAALAAGVKWPDQVDAFLDSLAFASRATYGGNTACVQVAGGPEYVVLDAGTGLRDLGLALLRTGVLNRPAVFHLFISHLHWDHLQGFPFFAPIFFPDCQIHVYGCHPDLAQAFQRQQDPPHFPVRLDQLRAQIDFKVLEPWREREAGGLAVTPFPVFHPQGCFGYRLAGHGGVMVYATDAEHKPAQPEPVAAAIRAFADSDLLIFDAQYSFRDTVEAKEDWGHSSNLMGVEMAAAARVRHLCLFHHEPAFSDATLDGVFAETLRLAAAYRSMNGTPYPERVSMAYDGLEVEI